MNIKPLAGGLASAALALFTLTACAPSEDVADPLTAHQYKYVPPSGDSTAWTSSELVGKNRMYARTRDEVGPIIRRSEPPPRPPVDTSRPRPPRPKN